MLSRQTRFSLLLVIFLLAQTQPAAAVPRAYTVWLPTAITALITLGAGLPFMFSGPITYITYQTTGYVVSRGEKKEAAPIDPVAMSYGKLIKLQIYAGVIMQLYETVLYKPFLAPMLEGVFENMVHPRFLKGESSATYVWRDKLRTCDNPLFGATVQSFPWSLLGICDKKKKMADFDQLIFAPQIKSEIKNFETLVRQRWSNGEGLPNLFLYGPAGTGKTVLAEALAQSLGFNFQRVTGSELVKNERGIEEFARILKWADAGPMTNVPAFQDTRPILFFMDEIEYFFRSRKSADLQNREYQVLSEFLALINNSGSPKYMIIVASNLPDKIQIDEAIVSRFDLSLKIEMPGLSERADIFRLYLKKRAAQIAQTDYDIFAQQTEGFSARDIRVTCDNLIAQAPTSSDLIASIARTKMKREQLNTDR